MHFLLKLAYEMHIKVLVNNDSCFPFICVEGQFNFNRPTIWFFQEVNLNHMSCFLFYVIFFGLNLSCLGSLMFRTDAVSFPLLVCIFSYR